MKIGILVNGSPHTSAVALILFLTACGPSNSADGSQQREPAKDQASAGVPKSAQGLVPGKTIHVLVALCDNLHQGIVPVPARIGNGDDPQNNLYWGAGFGVKTFFSRSAEWVLVGCFQRPGPYILERCVFRFKSRDVYIVADAYRGLEIRRCIADFLNYASTDQPETVVLNSTTGAAINVGGRSDLIAFVGHNGLMDFSLPPPRMRSGQQKDAIILCCASKPYFEPIISRTSANPLLWTTGLMAPEAYVLRAAIDGWILGESGISIRDRAANAYHKYQRCGLAAAKHLFNTGT